MNTIKRLRKNKKGFTLIEIIVVVVILAVLFAVAVPSVMKYMNEADDAKYMADGHSVLQSVQIEMAKAYAGDNVITVEEMEAVLNEAENQDNQFTVTDVKVYEDGANVTQTNDEITINGSEYKGVDNKVLDSVPKIGAVECVINNARKVVVVPNGKVYVGKK